MRAGVPSWLVFAWLLVPTLAVFGSSNASGQTVQLPTLRTFGVQTTVSVPDGGSAYLGGVTSSRSGGVTRGAPLVGRLPFAGRPFNNRAIGLNSGANRAFVRAQIIDLQAMDEAILRQARERRGAGDAVDQGTAFLLQHLGHAQNATTADRGAPTVAPPLPVRSSDDQTQQLLDLGDRALNAGDYELATRYYAAAERRAVRSAGRLR